MATLKFTRSPKTGEVNSETLILVSDKDGKCYGIIYFHDGMFIFEAAKNFVATTTMMFQIANKLQELNSTI